MPLDAGKEPSHADACWLKGTKNITRLVLNLVMSHRIKGKRSVLNVSDETAADGTKARSDMIIQMEPGNG